MTYLGHESYVGARALTEYRYKAFISYSHADERAGEWLHQALERYRVPANLVGAATDAGPVPEKLSPIFRDKNDLPAAGNLNDTIIAALKSSQFLIVLASPNAVKSKWVKEEIAQFKAFHGAARVLSIIIDGEPHASENDAIDSALECFPETLRYNTDENGVKTPAEPLAADARVRGQGLVHSFGNDGKKAAITKLAAGLIGVPLDDLVQREAKRDAARARMWTGVMGAIAGVMALTTIYAVGQRNEARAQRAEAESLIDFMITDVRKEVQQKVGVLDTLQMLGDRALAYYDRQNVRSLDDDALGRRARALHFSGTVEQQRNNLDAALAAYEEAAASTEELLKRDPENPDRIFEHAQSVFYVGDIAYKRSLLPTAEKYWTEYDHLAQALLDIEPDNPTYILEKAYAQSNLGSIRFTAARYDEAADYFEGSVASRKALYDSGRDNFSLAKAYAYALSWLAYAELKRGNFDESIRHISAQLDEYEKFPSEGENNFSILSATFTAKRRLANAYLYVGRESDSVAAINEASQIADRMLARDPENAEWLLSSAHIALFKSEQEILRNEPALAKSYAEKASKLAKRVLAMDSTNREAKVSYVLSLSANYALGSDTAVEEQHYMRMLRELEEAEFSGALEGFTALSIARAKQMKSTGDNADAELLLAKTTRKLEAARNKFEISNYLQLLELYTLTNQNGKATALAAELSDRGIAHPRFILLRNNLTETAALARAND